MNNLEKMCKALVNHDVKDIRVFSQFGLWHEFIQIRVAVADGSATVTDSKFENLYSWEEERKPDISKESTYAQCVGIVILPETSEVEIVFSDGDMCNGRPLGRRCSWVVKVDFNKIEFIKPWIKYAIDNLAEDIHKQELLDAKKQRRLEITEKLLKDVK